MIICLSELFFIHPESTYPYEGLLSAAATNSQNRSSNLTYNLGNLSIGVNSPVHAQVVKVDMSNWSDFVFKKEYN